MLNTNIYQISYDLKKFKDYPQLYQAILKLGPNVRVLESLWLVANQGTALAIRNHLQTAVDGDDRLFVCKIVPVDAASLNLPQNVLNWLKTHAGWV
ncbi:hypothetical protein [Undibacterium sp.]|uniref:hypothetical protein n=1 Tax=Undibacterium sp. TaxID=1914977 RepID=UPI0027313A89|nr:hypothetical protein [Undibacterium sp.]MDP1980568.1 hypothetical protein [Undibacterium sp.]